MAHSETKRPEPGAPQEMSSLLATNFLSPGSAKGGGSKSSLVDMISSGTPREDDESVKEAKLYETAKTVDLARKWTKGFRLAENIPVPKFYEASLSSMDMKSNSKKPLMYQVATDNTYKMEPDRRFQPQRVERVIKQVLTDVLTGVEYSARDTQHLCKMLTLRIRRGVKDLDFSRYRFVVHVTIGQLKRQCFQISSRFLWDHKIDGFATENFMNDTLFATCVVYAVYYE